MVRSRRSLYFLRSQLNAEALGRCNPKSRCRSVTITGQAQKLSMAHANLGNAVHQLVSGARTSLFAQGELAQLTYGAFDSAAGLLRANEAEEINIQFPVGYRPDRTSILGQRVYDKEGLLDRYRFLAYTQLPLNGIVQIVTVVEALLADVVRAIVCRYPKKIGVKQTVSMAIVLEAASIEEIHLRATDALLNDLTYKSPTEFAKALEGLLSINLAECPAFHRYVETKATRDIYIHNRGVANEVYMRKAGAHARVGAGSRLPIDIPYFLESYEACLSLSDWLERELHERWHSSEFEQRQLEIAFSPPDSPADSWGDEDVVADGDTPAAGADE